MNQNLDEVKEWFRMAEKDLLSAQILLNYEPPIIETSCFHCQQAIEKSLKAFLIWKNEPFEKTHDLTYLLELCENHELTFDVIKNKAKIITLYAAAVRYPLANLEVTINDAREAWDIANHILEVIRSLINM